MITGDLDLERTVWDVEYRRSVIAFLADQGGGTGHRAPARPSGPLSAPLDAPLGGQGVKRGANVIPFPRAKADPPADLRRAVEG